MAHAWSFAAPACMVPHGACGGGGGEVTCVVLSCGGALVCGALVCGGGVTCVVRRETRQATPPSIHVRPHSCHKCNQAKLDMGTKHQNNDGSQRKRKPNKQPLTAPTSLTNITLALEFDQCNIQLLPHRAGKLKNPMERVTRQDFPQPVPRPV